MSFKASTMLKLGSTCDRCRDAHRHASTHIEQTLGTVTGTRGSKCICTDTVTQGPLWKMQRKMQLGLSRTRGDMCGHGCALHCCTVAGHSAGGPVGTLLRLLGPYLVFLKLLSLPLLQGSPALFRFKPLLLQPSATLLELLFPERLGLLLLLQPHCFLGG